MPTVLSDYEAATLALLNDTNPPTLYSLPQIIRNINSARVQVAGDGECIRQLASINTVATQRGYVFVNAVFFAPSSTSGVGGILNIRDVGRSAPPSKLYGHTWEWLYSFRIQQAPSTTGPPTDWATYQSGDNGTFYLDPIPDAVYALQLDTVCFPIPLVDDTTVEALPYPWTDAVPYFTAYLSFLDQMRTADADAMFARYRLFARRGTELTTPTRLPDNFPGGAGAQQAMGRGLVGGPPERAPG
jgi:hypothetical protein